MLTYRPHGTLCLRIDDGKKRGKRGLMIYPDWTGHMIVLDRNGPRPLTDPKLWALYREQDRMLRLTELAAARRQR